MNFEQETRELERRTLPLYLIERYAIYNWRLHGATTVLFAAFALGMHLVYNTDLLPAVFVVAGGIAVTLWNKLSPVDVVYNDG